ncbi:hypothetical protein LH427_04475 [Laribacter hongkongensis]|uniref:hypothetical protein n=1 Tax=Laribacter hongkongensis TaxID=168471 RepID=UPI001EFE3F4B|nr:hypothetical protein [Laribacter hongkongensis]MCG8998421.1 hypothetical protein [Laribacter hongkongensis]MCG9013590.1 hypothetical protein [Laribacter hongkongensis]MCG9045102.1 hypothetical protein [Laribacter hongkongensis]MCG9061182.1 hypothetical protein [Laribacter hongkongensis]
MYVLAKTCLVLILASLVSGCGESENAASGQNNTPSAEQPTQSTKQASLDNVSYEISSEQTVGNVQRIEVTLHQRIDEPTLRLLAEKIKQDHGGSSESILIGYRIDGAPVNSIYWATTHYQPDLKVEISGASQEQYESVLSADESVPGERLGVWVEMYEPVNKMIAYKNKGKTFIRTFYPDGSSGDSEYKLLVRGDKKILAHPSDNDKEVFMAITKDGDLEYWNERGNYYTAPKFEKPKAAD